jgi:hypothetical protein
MRGSIAGGRMVVACRRSPLLRDEGPWGGCLPALIVTGMFLRYYLEIAAPFEDVEAALLDDPETWVPGLLRDAEDRGQRLLAEIGFVVDARRIDKEVEIEIGRPYRAPAVPPHRPSPTLLPMDWRATGPQGLFPHLEADIEVAPLGAERTHLSISGRYEPPMGALGRMLDRTLLHRVAEATVKDFLDRVGERIRAREPAST